MTKLGGTFGPAGEVALDVEELLHALRVPAAAASGHKKAIARYLAGEEGWREASQFLDGAFSGGAETAGEGKDDRPVNQPISEYLQRGPLKTGMPR